MLYPKAVFLFTVLTGLCLFTSLDGYQPAAEHSRTRQSLTGANAAGEPLILTDYYLKGEKEREKGRTLSQVVDLDGYEHTSYAGFFTVEKEFNSSMFFWFFPAQNGNTSAPLVLWLQGGPEVPPSMYGLFIENGPFYVTENLELKERQFSWNLKYNVLYIDNPVGSGFSFADSDKGLARDAPKQAEHLYSALQQFFYFFPEHVTDDLYLAGESYAGKFIPALGMKIHLENNHTKIVHKQSNMSINLVGISLGNPLIDPISTLDSYEILFSYLGLLTEVEALSVYSQEAEALDFIRSSNFEQANTAFNNILAHLQAKTELNLLNCMKDQHQTAPDYYIAYLDQSDVRAKIHVGDISFKDKNQAVEDALANNIMFTQASNFSILINEGYKTLLYSGMLDLTLAPSMTDNSLVYFNFDLNKEYHQAPRKVWKINRDQSTHVDGYVQAAKNFQRVIVFGAGRNVPFDQPERAYEMLTNFIDGKDFLG